MGVGWVEGHEPAKGNRMRMLAIAAAAAAAATASRSGCGFHEQGAAFTTVGWWKCSSP